MGWPKGKKRGPRTGVATKPSELVVVALKMAKLNNAHLALVSEISRLDGKTAQALMNLAGELRTASAKRVVTKTVTKIKHVASTVKPGKPGTPAAGKKTAPKAAKAAKARPAAKPKPSRSSKPSGPSGPKLKPVPAPATEPEREEEQDEQDE